MNNIGLTSEEAKRIENEGYVNKLPDDESETAGQIVRKNVLTYFNLIFAILAVLLLVTGQWKSLTFLPVVIINTLIGIFQQLRAKKVLDELSLLDVTKFHVLRDGNDVIMPSDRLVKGDVILLEQGQQIPADAKVVQGTISVNESLLTGESDEISKTDGSELMSGSFVVSGRCAACLTNVGQDSYINKLSKKAKKVSEHPAEMVSDIEKIIKICGIIIIPVGITMVVQSLINNRGFAVAISSMVSAVTAMIPQGMYLLATVAMALSAMRLGQKQVLLHDMHSIETLARVNVLCVDKTGTITTNEMDVSDVFAPKGKENADIDTLERYIATIQDENATMQALRKYCGDGVRLNATEVLEFSSKNKYSQVKTPEHTYRLGAPEFILSESAKAENAELLSSHAEKGERVLALVSDGEPIAFAALNNQIRKTAPETFSYFAEKGVEIKVISGDNPVTVSQVAKQAEIENADKYVDASTLRDDAAIAEAVDKYTVFGRVKPEQKKSIVRAIQSKKKKVAMTGDGVNDILAMKEADCSIAMGGGSDAARQAAQVVLLDSDFSKMKNIVSEGRRDVNNITRSATLFLYKNMFSLLLAIFSIIGGFVYPLKPNQVSLISGFNIGLPAFLLALEPNEKRQSGRFISHTLYKASPAALTSFFSIAFLVIFGQMFNISTEDIATTSTFLLALIGFLILWNISLPQNWYHHVVFAICIIGFLLGTTKFSFIFNLSNVSVKCASLGVVFAIAEITVMKMITWLFETPRKLRRLQQKGELKDYFRDILKPKN